MQTTNPLSRFKAPLHGARNPGRGASVTTPGSFALAPDIGGPLMFASPDTPGMPAPSKKTAWDFLPEGWSCQKWQSGKVAKWQSEACSGAASSGAVACVDFESARGEHIRVTYPADFTPTTQLEHARLGIVTPQMKRVAE